MRDLGPADLDHRVGHGSRAPGLTYRVGQRLTLFRRSRFGDKRPFFTEGADVFRFGSTRAFNRYGSQEYFYSRRVGRTPQRVLAGPAFPFEEVKVEPKKDEPKVEQ